MNMIAAVDSNWAIGNKNKLLISIPADMKMFRQETTGKVVVMGRKTLESFPNQKPLPNRTNIVLTRNKDYKVEGAVVVYSVEELLEELKQYNTEDVLYLHNQGLSDQDIADNLGCSVKTVQRALAAADSDDEI